jgi:hypothetical protein
VQDSTWLVILYRGSARYCTVFGKRIRGSTSAPEFLAARWEFAPHASRGMVHLDGECMKGKGVEPDVPIEDSPEA